MPTEGAAAAVACWAPALQKNPGMEPAPLDSEVSDVPDVLFRLHFNEAAPLESAFARVAQSERVGSCIIEPDPMQLLFVASEQVGGPLVERIYAEGGLAWCSRHSLQEFR